MFILKVFEKNWEEVARSFAKEYPEAKLKQLAINRDLPAFSDKTAPAHGTPKCITELALAILDIKPGERVADFCCGYGDFLSSAAKAQAGAELFGIEVEENAACFAKIRMAALGMDANIEIADTLSGVPEARFDKVFTNYPFGIRIALSGGSGKYYEQFKRGETGFGRPSSADWLFNLAAFHALAPKGKAVAIMTNGSLLNGGDRQARKFFIDNDMIESIIALPGNLFSYTAIQTTLIVLGHNAGAIRIVDAADLSLPGRRQDTMGPDEIAEVLTLLENDGKNSRLVSKEEIAYADYCLYPPRFLGRSIVLENPVPLGELALSIERGASLSADALDEITTPAYTGMSYLRLADISDGWIGSDLPHITVIDQKLHKQCLKDGDLIVSKNGAPFKIAVAKVPEGQTVLANGNLHIVRLNEELVDPYYVAAFLVSESGKELMARLVVGTVIPNLPMGNLKKLEIPLLPMEQQKEIANNYQARLDEIDVLKIKLEKARIGITSVYDEVMQR